MGSPFVRAGVLCIAILVGIAIFYLSGTKEEFFGFQFRGQEVPVWHAGVAFLATILGVIFALFVQHYREELVNLTWKAFAKSALRFSTPGSLIVAAVVYVFAFQSIYNSVGDWIAYFSAFQSGFFFEQTLASLAKGERPAT